MIEIKLDEKNVQAAMAFLSNAPKEVERAASAAINRTITKLTKDTSVAVRRRYVAKAATVKKALDTKRASSGNLMGRLSATGSTLPLTAFRISKSQTGPMRVKVLQGSSPKPVKGLFSRRFPGGYIGPMKRISRQPYPLKTPAGPSVPQMVGNENTLRELVPEAERTLNERFIHEVEFRMGRIK